MIKKINLILIIIWMITVFSFSNQTSTQSSGLSGKLTTKIVNILHITEGCTEEDEKIVISNVEHIIRKMAHYSIYALGGFLIYLEMTLYKISFKFKVLFTQLLGSIYAVTDEVHQFFIPGRSARIRDVIIDSFGIFTGIIVAIIVFIIIEKIIMLINKKEKVEER